MIPVAFVLVCDACVHVTVPFRSSELKFLMTVLTLEIVSVL